MTSMTIRNADGTRGYYLPRRGIYLPAAEFVRASGTLISQLKEELVDGAAAQDEGEEEAGGPALTKPAKGGKDKKKKKKKKAKVKSSLLSFGDGDDDG